MYVTPQENAIETMLQQHQSAGGVLLEPQTRAVEAMDQNTVDRNEHLLVNEVDPSAEIQAQNKARMEQLALWSHDVSGQIASVHRANYLGHSVHSHAPEAAPQMRPPHKPGIFARVLSFITGENI